MPVPNLILFDGSFREQLLPFTFTRPVADVRCGILTIREKWEKHLHSSSSTQTKPYLAGKFPLLVAKENLVVNASVLPSEKLVKAILNLKKGQALMQGELLIAAKVTEDQVSNFDSSIIASKFQIISYPNELFVISRPWDIFKFNDAQIRADFDLLTKNRDSRPVSKTVTQLGNSIFLEDGASIEVSIVNTLTGPVYLGRNAEIMEGCMVRGPFALGDGAVLKMGSKIYGATTLGPYSKAGGEINNSVIFGYSNKAHDGFLGNSVIGEWCNLGADTNNSNLKNNYTEVRVWDYVSESFLPTGLQFCGLMMGDHSKCGINTMFNTGTVVGVSANIFGAGFPRNFIPSYSWGGSGKMIEYDPAKAIEVAQTVMARRGFELTENDKLILKEIFQLTAKFRRFK